MSAREESSPGLRSWRSLSASVRDRVSAIYNWFAVLASRDPRWHEADDWRRAGASEMLIPVRVCPRRCTFELARREFVTRTSLWGQARVRVCLVFDSSRCSRCGSELVERCGRCKDRILAPVEDRCRSCGLPQPWSPERLLAMRTRPQRWDEKAPVPATLIYESPHKDRLLAIDGDVTNIAVDGVLSNDDVDGRMYTMIASSLKAAAGPHVEQYSISGGPYPRGTAWHTDGGSLPPPVKEIVHVAALDRRGKIDTGIVADCICSALEKSRERRLGSLAIATFGTGPEFLELHTWLTTAAQAILSHFANDRDGADRLPLAALVVLYEPDDFDRAVATLRAAAQQWKARPGSVASRAEDAHICMTCP